jgi:SRP-independent targeting protein 2/TMEM208
LHFISARQATGSFYRPFLLLVNGAYLALVYYLRYSSTSTATSTTATATATTGNVPSTVSLAVATLAIWVVQYLCYQSILDDAALKQPSTSSSSSSLAGGIALDLLAFVIVVQFAALLWSTKAYWGLWVVPLAMAWQLYKTIRASIPPTSSSSVMPSAPSTTPTQVTSSAARGGNTKRR